MMRCKSESSANKARADSTVSGISLMYMRKSKGPNTDPCGPPDSTCDCGDVVPLTTTHWVLFDRKSVIHAKISFRMP